jgi:AcrR family transcriptional regulator
MVKKIGKVSVSPHRRPKSGGYECGDEMRTRIILAAVRVFGDNGYLLASTREIATAAGINHPALHYYFDSKEGLHRACGQLLGDMVEQSLSTDLSRAETVLASGKSADAAIALCSLLETLLEQSLTANDAQDWSRFFIRLQSDGKGPAHAVVSERVFVPLCKLCAGLLALAKKRAESDPEIQVGAIFLMELAREFAADHSKLLAPMGWTVPQDVLNGMVKQMFRHLALAAISGPSSPTEFHSGTTAGKIPTPRSTAKAATTARTHRAHK